MAINATREKYFFQFLNEDPPDLFQHTPASSKPAQPALPDGLSGAELAELAKWQAAPIGYSYIYGTNKQVLYNAMTTAGKAKADQFTAFTAAYQAWLIADRLARMSQWAWMRADAALMNYDTVPVSGSNAGTGSSPPATPVTKQEP